MELWGTPGPSVHWGYRHDMEVAQKIDVVADVVSTTEDSVLVTLFPGGQRAKFLGALRIPGDCLSFSAFDATLIGKDPIPCFMIDDPTDILYHHRSDRRDFDNVIELCAGLGVGTIGVQTAGMSPVCAVDWSPKMLQAYSEMHPEAPTVLGDLCDKATIKKVYKVHPRSAVLMSGFSCQPFSRGGQQRGAEDQRSGTLLGTLRAAYMLRCVGVILECVKDAGRNAMVRQQLESFQAQCKFHLTEAILRLEDVWISKRERWWACLTAPFVGRVQIDAFVPLDSPSVPRDLLPRPLALDFAALAQLELRGSELEAFLQYQPDLASMFLKLGVKAPTALHSWGSQVVGCECGCRTSGFSHDTLSNRGLFGLLFPVYKDPHSEHPEVPAVRHPHPTEVAVLTGVPELIWPSNLRLCLAGLGQQASPLQSVWIAAHLIKHVDMVFTGTSTMDPMECLQELRARVCAVADHLEFAQVPQQVMPEPPIDPESDSIEDDVSAMPWVKFQHLGGPEDVTVVYHSNPVPFVARVSDPDGTIAAVLCATFELLGAEERVDVIDCSSGLKLHPGALARGLCIWVCPIVVVPVLPPAPIEVSPTVPWQAEEPVAEVAPEQSVPSVLESVSDGGASLAVRAEPLVALDASRLALVPEPSITDVKMMHALRKQTIDVESRKAILANQGTLWSDDELCWHVDKLMTAANKRTWVFLDPLLAAEAIKRPSQSLLEHWFKAYPTKPTAIIGLVPIENHWVPFLWTWTVHCMIASSWDVPGSPGTGLSLLHQALANIVGSRTFTVHVVHRKFAVNEFCGICALRFIDHMLRGKMLPTDMNDVRQLHAMGRSMFVEFLDSCTTVSRPWIWCAGLDTKAAERLAALLQEHGVQQAQVQHRSALLVQAIGTATAQKALTSGQPWRALKGAANNCRPPFQLVLPQELEEVVKTKAAQGGIKGKRKKGSSGPVPTPKLDAPAVLDPAKLALQDGGFVTTANDDLPQLQMKAIGPFAQGVILTTIDEASAYLKAGQLVSNGALALVLLNAEEAQLVTTLAWSFQRVVLRCQANGEPMLAPAYLVQLGKTPVVPKTEKEPQQVLHAPAMCCKVTLYRDELEGDWSQVVRSPVKFVLSFLTPLLVCTNSLPDQPCTCGKWHPTVDDVVADPVLDVWRRQWLSMSFRPSAPDGAEVFLFNMRCLASLDTALLTFACRAGIYIEPRSLDARDPLMDYQVLWLPKTPLAELQRLQQCNASIIGLARMGSRMGVRTKASEAADLAKQLKPGSIFLAAGTKFNFELGPLPFGMDRMSVARLCAQWGWQARPMHPSRAVEGTLGTMWLVQARTGPPNTVVRYQGAEVVITKLQDKQESTTQLPTQVIGSTSTVQMCKKTAGSLGVDPWLANDPWAPASGTVPAPAAVDSQATLRDLEARLESKILAKLPTQDMEVDSSGATDARFAALEQQVHSLSMHQQALDAKIDDNASKTESQFATMQTHMTRQLDTQGQQIQSLFASQMTQIEALLAKKHRAE